ncbi:urease accessory protein UreD [Cordyceps militaris CM01]|uniref:Urease accessory protein UreD n=1 Tax=Cordyceps militaris (strain CM01) TaxID=983644 RepID=G3JD84_CORMM|nr:urease accessory protein UreD [Cordyceps militaris CM01]EGX92559.1 urease accessory protein UreD [Cordyceps militaris CM01]
MKLSIAPPDPLRLFLCLDNFPLLWESIVRITDKHCITRNFERETLEIERVTQPPYFSMPHKHKRKRGDDADFNLPPSQRAMPLPVNSKTSVSNGISRQAKKRRQAKSDMDAPRAFQRLMAFSSGKKFHPGLDDGKSKKPTETEPRQRGETLQIKPGEDLRAFAARVDAAMPLAGVSTKSGIKGSKDLDGIKTKRTRKERKMHKLYDQWREEELKIQEQREEEKELAAEREIENDGVDILSTSVLDAEEGSNRKKKGKHGKYALEDDPWAELKKKRGELKHGLNDVAEAPPELHKKQSRLLKVVGTTTVNVGSVPQAAGSLRRREQLEEERQDVVETYRRIREYEQRKLDSQKVESRN